MHQMKSFDQPEQLMSRCGMGYAAAPSALSALVSLFSCALFLCNLWPHQSNKAAPSKHRKRWLVEFWSAGGFVARRPPAAFGICCHHHGRMTKRETHGHCLRCQPRSVGTGRDGSCSLTTLKIDVPPNFMTCVCEKIPKSRRKWRKDYADWNAHTIFLPAGIMRAPLQVRNSQGMSRPDRIAIGKAIVDRPGKDDFWVRRR